MRIAVPVSLASATFLAPALASAHEVYVLPPEKVAEAVRTPAFSLVGTALSNPGQFLFWALVVLAVILFVFFIATRRALERLLDPLLAALPPYAPVIGRVAISLSFLAAAYYQALPGPELPLTGTFAGYEPFIRGILVAVGLMLLFGFYTRVAAFAALVLFGIEFWVQGWYMLTYASYVGDLLLLLILGGHLLAFHHRGHDEAYAPRWITALKKSLMPLAFPILRISFGLSLLYASLYAKVIHNALALSVTAAYPDIVRFFGFEPHFLVLGAGILECLIALFFILGIEIRFAALFLLFWLMLSLSYFGEAVWPHVMLIGVPLAFICYGYDRYSLEGRFFKKGGREPVL